MQNPDSPEESIIDVFSTNNLKVLNDLEIAKRELKEKNLVMEEMSKLSTEKFKEMSYINKDLQDKIRLVQDMSNSLESKNRELESEMKHQLSQKNIYHKLNEELKKELEQVTLKEKELAMKKEYFENQVKTKSKELVKAAKMAAIGKLTEGLVNEIKAPLKTINNTQKLLKDQPHLSLHERFAILNKNDIAISKINYLVNDTLNFVKTHDLDFRTYSLSAILDSVLDSINVPSKIKLTKEVSDISLFCDSKKIHAVLANLLVNSIDALGDEGHITIRMHEQNDHAIIEFEDSGPGFPRSLEASIFEPLFTTKPSGTGLGLPICKTIIHQHGGDISVKTDPTIFRIILPKKT